MKKSLDKTVSRIPLFFLLPHQSLSLKTLLGNANLRVRLLLNWGRVCRDTATGRRWILRNWARLRHETEEWRTVSRTILASSVIFPDRRNRHAHARARAHSFPFAPYNCAATARRRELPGRASQASSGPTIIYLRPDAPVPSVYCQYIVAPPAHFPNLHRARDAASVSRNSRRRGCTRRT